MSRDQTSESERSYGYHGEQGKPAENQAGPAPSLGGTKAADNRGQRAPSSGSGGVTGSGASAGGGGGPEDYDSDPMAGGGTFPRHPESAPDEGGDAPKHNSR
jgi:hypothetical protein